MRRVVFSIAFAASVVLILVGLSYRWVLEQTRYVPEFYAEATREQGKITGNAKERLQAEVAKLQEDVANRNDWHAAFSDAQINAWLADELPRMFPRLSAMGTKEPRIMIKEDCVFAAVRFQHPRVDTVISCELRVELTKQPNLLAFRLANLRAGALPLPLSKFLGGISKEAAKGGLDVRWDMTDTGPIALVTVPSEDPRYVHSPVVVESVHLVRGAMYLKGCSGNEAVEQYKPHGPLHQFVSYKPTVKRTAQLREVSPTVIR